jgi:hypothetical protein
LIDALFFVAFVFQALTFSRGETQQRTPGPRSTRRIRKRSKQRKNPRFANVLTSFALVRVLRVLRVSGSAFVA